MRARGKKSCVVLVHMCYCVVCFACIQRISEHGLSYLCFLFVLVNEVNYVFALHCARDRLWIKNFCIVFVCLNSTEFGR